MTTPAMFRFLAVLADSRALAPSPMAFALSTYSWVVVKRVGKQEFQEFRNHKIYMKTYWTSCRTINSINLLYMRRWWQQFQEEGNSKVCWRWKCQDTMAHWYDFEPHPFLLFSFTSPKQPLSRNLWMWGMLEGYSVNVLGTKIWGGRRGRQWPGTGDPPSTRRMEISTLSSLVCFQLPEWSFEKG